jgi:2-polyprenyl-3-methyl-5-hydroxy-6-metoxy-1,4-benzoquinol methylase
MIRMTATTAGISQADEARRDALVQGLFTATVNALELLHVYIGDRLGLYRVMSERGSAMSAPELAAAASISERYAREWLEQQAVAGILDVDPAEPEQDRLFRLPAAHMEVLLDADSLSYLGPLASAIASIGGAMPAILEAFRNGGGVPYASYGDDMREAIARLNRPMFVNLLGTQWLPAVLDIDQRLRADPPARVADVGCGVGWSSLSIARAYPNVTVDGIDLDEASIAEAQKNAAASGLGDRVNFVARSAADPRGRGEYDLVTAFETMHDMADPVGALRAMRALLAPGGAVFIADERAGEEFAAPGDDVERWLYGWSTLHCLPVGMVDAPAAGTGAVMRPSTLRRYAAEAGFAGVELLPIEHEFWRFYRLVP